MTGQYIIGAVPVLSNFELDLARCFSFASAINFVHSFTWWSNISLL